MVFKTKEYSLITFINILLFDYIINSVGFSSSCWFWVFKFYVLWHFFSFSIEKEYVMPWVIHLYHSLYLECHWIIFFFIGMHIDVISLGKYNLYVIFLNKRCLQSPCKYNFDVDTPLTKDLSCHFNLNFFCREENTLTRLSPNLDDDLKTSLMMWE